MRTKALTAALLAAALMQGASARDTPDITEAHKAYYDAQFSRPLVLYEALAAAGNAEAAERAGFMLLHGNELFGRQVECDPGRARMLLVQAAKAGRTGAGFLLNLLEHAD